MVEEANQSGWLSTADTLTACSQCVVYQQATLLREIQCTVSHSLHVIVFLN